MNRVLPALAFDWRVSENRIHCLVLSKRLVLLKYLSWTDCMVESRPFLVFMSTQVATWSMTEDLPISADLWCILVAASDNFARIVCDHWGIVNQTMQHNNVKNRDHKPVQIWNVCTHSLPYYLTCNCWVIYALTKIYTTLSTSNALGTGHSTMAWEVILQQQKNIHTCDEKVQYLHFLDAYIHPILVNFETSCTDPIKQIVFTPPHTSVMDHHPLCTSRATVCWFRMLHSALHVGLFITDTASIRSIPTGSL